MKKFTTKAIHLLIVCLLSACTILQEASTPTSIPATPTASLPPIPGFSEDAVRTLASLQQVDEYPLYVMRYYGEYDSLRTSSLPFLEMPDPASSWACSLFTTLPDDDHLLYGRNFDWDFSPALLLFTNPPDGYASVSMVNIDTPKYSHETLRHIMDLPLEERANLLYSPLIPFDGMNEHGLVIGMAAVPSGNMTPDPSRKTIGSLLIMREILDHARTVKEALAIINKYNIAYTGGPDLHYLIANAEGQSVLVEFHLGKMHVIENEQPWHLATNFLVASVKDPVGHDLRYDRIHARLSETQGRLDTASAMKLLSEVSQGTTQWSVVYQMADQEVHVVMGKDYTNVHIFHAPDYFDAR